MTASSVAVRVTARMVEPFTARMGKPHITFDALLEFRAADPLEFRATFSDADGVVTWVWSREVLAAAAYGESAGYGQVRMWRGGGEVMVRLESHPSHGATRCVLALPLADVRRFLARAHDLVPPGTEADFLDLDAELRALLGAD